MDFSSPTEIFIQVWEPEKPLSPWVRMGVHATTKPGFYTREARLRTISDFEVILQLEGQTWIWLDPFGSVDVKPGDVIFNPPALKHGWAYNAGSHLALHFDFYANREIGQWDNLHPTEYMVQRRPTEVLPRFILGCERSGRAKGTQIIPFVTPVRHPAVWKHQLARVIDWWQRDQGQSASFQLLASETVGWIVRTLAEDAAAAGLVRSIAGDAAILSLLEEMEKLDSCSRRRWPTVADMAQRAGLGQTAFHERFRAATGETPRKYLEVRRVERAKRLLLETAFSVVEIAAMEGYDDAYHFSRVFKRVTGSAPSRFRHQKIQARELGNESIGD